MANHLQTTIGQYALILKDKKLLLLYPPQGPYWHFPGGRLDNEEDHQESLIREVKEETDLMITSMEPFDIKMWSVHGKKHRYAVCFLCTLEDDHAEIVLSNEHTKFRWFTYDDVLHERKTYPIGDPGVEVVEKLRKKELM